MDLKTRIETLNDNTALRVLTTFANASAPSQSETSLSDPALITALRSVIAPPTAPESPSPESSPPRPPPSDGDLTRSALQLLASAPGHQAGITALLDNPIPQRLAVWETVTVVTAVLLRITNPHQIRTPRRWPLYTTHRKETHRHWTTTGFA